MISAMTPMNTSAVCTCGGIVICFKGNNRITVLPEKELSEEQTKGRELGLPEMMGGIDVIEVMLVRRCTQPGHRGA